MTSQIRILGRRVALEVLTDHEMGQVSGGGPYSPTLPDTGTNGQSFCNPTPNGTGGSDWDPDDCAP